MIALIIYITVIFILQNIIQRYSENTWKKDFISVLSLITYWLLVILFITEEILYMNIVGWVVITFFLLIFISRVLPALSLNFNKFEVWESKSLASLFTWIKEIDWFDVKKNVEKAKNQINRLIQLSFVWWIAYISIFIYYMFIFTNK